MESNSSSLFHGAKPCETYVRHCQTRSSRTSWSLCFIFSSATFVAAIPGSESKRTTKLVADMPGTCGCVVSFPRLQIIAARFQDQKIQEYTIIIQCQFYSSTWKSQIVLLQLQPFCKSSWEFTASLLLTATVVRVVLFCEGTGFVSSKQWEFQGVFQEAALDHVEHKVLWLLQFFQVLLDLIRLCNRLFNKKSRGHDKTLSGGTRVHFHSSTKSSYIQLPTPKPPSKCTNTKHNHVEFDVLTWHV